MKIEKIWFLEVNEEELEEIETGGQVLLICFKEDDKIKITFKESLDCFLMPTGYIGTNGGLYQEEFKICSDDIISIHPIYHGHIDLILKKLETDKEDVANYFHYVYNGPSCELVLQRTWLEWNSEENDYTLEKEEIQILEKVWELN